jgi:hypothetical protein
MPVVTFVDPDTVHNPSSGTAAPATWFTNLEANFRSITGRVGAKIYAATTEDFAIPGPTVITLGSTDFNNGMDVSVGNTIKVPASYAGKYLVTACLRVVSVPSALNTCTMSIYLNGATTGIEEIASRSGATGSASTVSVSTTMVLAVADLLTLRVAAAGMSDADTEVSVSLPSLSAFWLSA